jgi:hypothetical protein
LPNSDVIRPPYFLETLWASRSNLAEPILSSRLAEFKTADTEPLKPHKDWLAGDVAGLIRRTPGCWVSLYGHASMAGNASYNLDLSRRRILAVEEELKRALRGVAFDSYKDVPRGVADSGWVVGDNSGAFRAVEVFVYPPVAPRPEKKLTEALSFKKTLRHVVTVEQWDPPDPGDKWAKAGKAISDSIREFLGDTAGARAARVQRHPAERDMPDFGKELGRRTIKVEDEEVLVAIDIDTAIKTDRSFIIVGTQITVDFETEYRYSYARGPRTTRPVVRRVVNNVHAPAFFIDQPGNLADP